jgi:hypothetical protein
MNLNILFANCSSRTVGVQCILAGLSAAALFAQGAGSPSPGGWVLNKTDLITPGDLPRHLETSPEHTGNHMKTADKAQITRLGTVKDSRGSRSAQIAVEVENQ